MSEQAALSNEQLAAALEAFVIDNDDLLELEAIVGRFNVFDALGVARREIHHSNFLAFVLDPSEAHGLSQLFLLPVLIDILKSVPSDGRPLSPLDLDGADLRGVEIRREWKSIDVLITCKEPRFVIAIENKVDAEEHSNQLVRYQKTVAEHYPDVPTLFVFLTPTGEEPSEAGWHTYTYRELHRVLMRIRASNAGSIGDDVRVFLDHYLNLIGTRLMNDERIDELCERIWKNHRVAMQLVYDRVGRPGAWIEEEVEKLIKSDQHWHCFYGAGGVVDFVPASWEAWLPDVGSDYKKYPKSWVVCRFQIDGKKLVFYVEVRRTIEPNLRTEVIKTLLAEASNSFGLKKPRSKSSIGVQYTRVTGKDEILSWDEESEPTADAIIEAVKKKLDDIKPKLVPMGAAIRSVIDDHAGPLEEDNRPF